MNYRCFGALYYGVGSLLREKSGNPKLATLATRISITPAATKSPYMCKTPSSENP
jgi:hypothetical protein